MSHIHAVWIQAKKPLQPAILGCSTKLFQEPKKLTKEEVGELQRRREQGVLIKTLMKDYALSKASVYRYLGQADSSQSAQEI